MHHIFILNTWGSWKPNIHCYKPSAVETMTLLQTLGRRIQQHCCKPSAVEPRHCYGFSAMIPFCGTFPKDSKSTALGLLGFFIYLLFIYWFVYLFIYITYIQWEFQDPKMEVLYHVRLYVVGIFPYIGLTNRPYTW